VCSVCHSVARLVFFPSFLITHHPSLQTWRLSSAASSTDVKELIPEFFFFPEFLVNLNRFDMGLKQNEVRIDHVKLPPWANGDAHLFIRKQREALECPFVSQNLHHWIDLVFGDKQTGDAAAAAKNLFHPLTYEGADIASSDGMVTHDHGCDAVVLVEDVVADVICGRVKVVGGHNLK
jgi:lysosomal-trafficking regulator